MKPEKTLQLLAWISTVERSSAETLGRVHGARFDYRGGAYEMRLGGVAGTSTMSRDAAKESWLRAARKRVARGQDACPGHVASPADRKVCRRCGIHIDELRPDADPTVDVYSPWGSGPAPIERREGEV